MIPILTRYEGVFDCFATVVREEGFRGLFKVKNLLITVRKRMTTSISKVAKHKKNREVCFRADVKYRVKNQENF